MATKGVSRRTFVNDMTAAGLGMTVIPSLLHRTRRSPNDGLNVACIGVGGMGRNDVRGMESENIYALCDVDGRAAEDAFRSYPDAKRYTDFREMFAREADSIDAVTVSTPDHCHAAAAMMALKLGKPVYCQKPLARTIGEVRALMDGARQANVATQMGNQGHANEGTRQIREWVEAGAIGTVKEVQFWTNRPIWAQAIDRPLQAYFPPTYLDWNLWLGPAAERPYAPAYAPFRWRGWWDFGTGAMGDMACHIMDAAFWTLDLRYPTTIVPEYSQLFDETAPATSRIHYHFPASDTRPEVSLVWRDGGLLPPKPIDWPSTMPWPPQDGGGQLWLGSDGALVAGVYGEDPRLVNEERNRELQANPPEEKFPRVESVYAEWIDAIKGGPPAGSNFAGYAGPLTEMILLGNLALRIGQTVELDPAGGAITNVRVPEEWVMPEYRDGWEL
jgi:predicted dehydrogenase